MATSDFLPTSEAALAGYSTNFSTVISADPAAVGLDVAQAGAFAVLNTAWVDSYNVILNGLTRSPSNIATKNTNKNAMVVNLRELAALVQAHPGITDAQLLQLGLTVRDTEPTVIPAPTTKPVFTLGPISDRTVKFILRDELAPDRKAKPAGVFGAQVLTFIGDVAPTDIRDWSFESLFTRTDGEVIFPAATPAFSKVWLAAYWVNPKGESGPTSIAVSTNLGDGLSQAA